MVGPCAKNIHGNHVDRDAQGAKRRALGAAAPTGRPSIDREFEYEYSLGAGWS